MKEKQPFLGLILALLLTFWPGFAFARESNDPHTIQWGYEHTGVYDAWDLSTGSKEVVVAIIDNGFDHFHPDLRDNAWINNDEIKGNGIDDDKNGYIDDIYGWNFIAEDINNDGQIKGSELNGNNNPRPDPADLTDTQKETGVVHHGSLVAGIIGAAGNNKMDGVGINWDIKLMNIKLIDNTGFGSLSKLSDAIRYAVDNGADIVNMSVIGLDTPPDIEEVIRYAYDNDVVLVAAAGNNMTPLNDMPYYPVCIDADLDEELILGVSAMTEEHRIAKFSNYGSDCIDITAPGVSVSSTQRYSPTNDLSIRYGGGWNGTSFAAPFVSGAAALVKSVRPSWGPEEIYNALLETVHHTPGQDEAVYANLFGAGMLQVDKALSYAISGEEIEVVEEEGVPEVIATESRITNYQAWAISTDGRLVNYDFDTEVTSLVSKSSLNGVEDVATYSIDGRDYYVTMQDLGDKKQINFYTSEWVYLKNWEVRYSGKVQLLVGDITNSGKVEVVLVSKNEGRQVFKVYDHWGNLLKNYVLSDKQYHNGVRGVINNNRLAILLRTNGQMNIIEFDDELDKLGTTYLNFDRHYNSLGVGDLDGDGDSEWVVGAASGEGPFVSYYNHDGALLRSFYSFSPSYTGGFTLSVADVDSDGLDEVVTMPYSGESARVWSNRSKLEFKWDYRSVLEGNAQMLLIY